jgi:hypothetical protein
VCALAGHARDHSAHAGRVKLQLACPTETEAPLEKQENEYADTRFAGALRPRAALFVWRVRELCTRHVVTKPFAAHKHGVDVGEPRAWRRRRRRCREGPSRLCFLRFFLWAFSQTIFSCFHKRDSCFQFNMLPIPNCALKPFLSSHHRTKNALQLSNALELLNTLQPTLLTTVLDEEFARLSTAPAPARSPALAPAPALPPRHPARLRVNGSAQGVKVGRCRLTVSKPVLKAPMVLALEARI